MAGLVGSIAAMYSVGRLVDEGRYWYDYYQTTGHFPRYPFRSTNFGKYALGAMYASGGKLKRL